MTGDAVSFTTGFNCTNQTGDQFEAYPLSAEYPNARK